jgi:hypothetical protein
MKNCAPAFDLQQAIERRRILMIQRNSLDGEFHEALNNNQFLTEGETL